MFWKKEKKKTLLDEAISDAVEANNLKAFKSLSEMQQEENERAEMYFRKGFLVGGFSATVGAIAGTLIGKHILHKRLKKLLYEDK